MPKVLLSTPRTLRENRLRGDIGNDQAKSINMKLAVAPLSNIAMKVITVSLNPDRKSQRAIIK